MQRTPKNQDKIREHRDADELGEPKEPRDVENLEMWMDLEISEILGTLEKLEMQIDSEIPVMPISSEN